MRRLDDDTYLAKLMFLLTHPSKQMIAAGKAIIPECVEALYVGSTAPHDIFTAMTKIALEQAERG